MIPLHAANSTRARAKHLAGLGALTVSLGATSLRAAPNVVYTLITNASGNISSAALYSGGGAVSSTTVGDTLQDTSGTASGATITLDIPVTIGTVRLNAGGVHSATFSGSNAFILNSTGGTTTNGFGDTNASIGIFAAAGVLTINNIVSATSTLEIGSNGSNLATGTSTVIIGGNNTAATTTTLSLLNNNPYTSTSANAPIDQITGTIGATGSAINIVNAGTLGTTKSYFDLTGIIGEATGTGAVVTITNSGTGATNFKISGALGATVSSITQNAANSTMTISGASPSFAGTTSIQADTLTLGSATGLGNSAVTLSNVAAATLNVTTATSIGSLAGGGTTGGNVTTTGIVTTGGNNTSTTYSGIISGAGGLGKTGTGTLTRAGTNVYTGATTISGGGTLLVNGGLSSTTGGVTVGTATVNSGTPGGTGTLTINVAPLVAVPSTTTVGSAAVTVTDASGLAVGMLVEGNSVPAETIVNAISGTTLTLSNAVTVANSAVSLHLCVKEHLQRRHHDRGGQSDPARQRQRERLWPRHRGDHAQRRHALDVFRCHHVQRRDL